MKSRILCSALLVLALVVPVSSFAVEPQHISPEKFREYASLPIGTMRYSEFLGVTEGKAFVAVNEMSSLGSKQWSRTVYWVESEKLDPKLLQQLAKQKQ
jgi:hypothetical protein